MGREPDTVSRSSPHLPFSQDLSRPLQSPGTTQSGRDLMLSKYANAMAREAADVDARLDLEVVRPPQEQPASGSGRDNDAPAAARKPSLPAGTGAPGSASGWVEYILRAISLRSPLAEPIPAPDKIACRGSFRGSLTLHSYLRVSLGLSWFPEQSLRIRLALTCKIDFQTG